MPHPHEPYTSTLSPTSTPAAPSPRAATTPAPSWPRVSGSPNVYASAGIAITCSSEWHTPAAVTRSSTWPGPGSGCGTSTSSGRDPMVRYCRARIASSSTARPDRNGSGRRREHGGVSAIDTSIALPAPTDDLDRADHDLSVHGICAVTCVLSGEQLGSAHDELYAAAAQDRARGREHKFG